MKLRNISAVLLSVLLLVTCVPLGTFTVSAAASGTTGDCAWMLDGTRLTISGNGAMANYNNMSNLAPWGRDITEVIITDGVTNVGDFAFYFCSNLVSATLSDGVQEIGKSAFYHCDSLKSITIPLTLVEIEYQAFEYCTSLPGIIIPEGVTYIGDGAFGSCRKIKEVVIPSTVALMGSGVFRHCTSLSSLTVCQENEIFYSSGNCIVNKSTKTLVSGCNTCVIPAEVTQIGEYALSGFAFSSIQIPDNVSEIGDWALAGADMISIALPKNLMKIGTGAFYLCDALADVYYFGSKSDRAKINVSGSNSALTDATWHYAPCENDTHVYSYACATICQNCDNRRSEEVSHTYENNCDAQCDICGESRAVKHQFIKVGENVATCQHCSISKIFDFIMTNHEVLTVSYEATRDFDIVVEDVGVARIGDISSSVIAIGSYYRKSSSAQVLPVCPGETEIQVVSADGKILTSAGLLVVEGDHRYDDEYDVDCNVCGATREVPEKPVDTAYGDCNGDDEINNRDLVLLQQYLNGWDVDAAVAAADVNADGEVNNRDLVLLQQYLNGWDVTLG